MHKFNKLSIIIPVYNEAKTIFNVLNTIRVVELVSGIQKQLVIVNDCSEDDTEVIILEYQKQYPEVELLYIKHEINKGKGAAIHTGIAMVSGDYVIIQDADLEYDPQEYNSLIKPVLSGYADVVFGSRFMGHNPHRILFFWHSIGNKFLTFLSNIFNNLNLTDLETCYKLVNTQVLKTLQLQERRFGFEPEITAKVSRVKNIRIYEVGISYYGRTYSEGKKIKWKDGVRAVYCIIKYGLFA